MPSDDNKRLYAVAVLGSSGVGKSSLCFRVISAPIPNPNYELHMEEDFRTEHFEVDGEKCTLSVTAPTGSYVVSITATTVNQPTVNLPTFLCSTVSPLTSSYS